MGDHFKGRGEDCRFWSGVCFGCPLSVFMKVNEVGFTVGVVVVE